MKYGRAVPSWVRSGQKLKKWTPVASMVHIHHWRARAGLVGPVSV